MSQEPTPSPQQRLNIDHTTISDAQIGGIAGRDIVQNQGSGNVFKDVVINLFQGSSASPSAGLSRQDYRNRLALIHKVKNYWIKGVLDHSLQQRSHMSLQFESRPETVMAPWQVVDYALDARPQMLPPSTRVIDVLDELGVGRSLLILGEPGSGKTTVLLELARELMVRVEQDVTQPIPVVFNLSSWSCRKQTIAEWLIEELNSKYQVPKAVGRSWVETQALLLLLDGLDEVQQAQRDNCISALNEFHQAYGPELVVCCRTRNYEALDQQLRFEAAIQLRSLTHQQIFERVREAGEDLEGLQKLLEEDEAMRELATSPLMLNIMMTAYDSLNDEQIMDTGLLERKRSQLFDAYIDQMFVRRDLSMPFSRAQVVKGLAWLARNMEIFSQSVFLIEEMHPDWLRTPARQRLYRIGVKTLFLAPWGGLHMGLIAGLLPDPSTFSILRWLYGTGLGLLGGILYGVIGGLLGGLVTSETSMREGSLINGLLLGGIFGPLFGLSMLNTGMAWQYGIAYGIVYGLLGIYIYGLIHELRGFNPIDNLRWSGKKALRYLPFGVAIALVLEFGTSIGVFASILVGLLFNFIVGFENTRDVDQRTIPNYKIWRSAVNSAKLFAIVAPISGVVFYIAHGWSVPSGVANGLIFGVGAALIGAGGAGLNCIKHLVLRLILWYKRYAPWNYARFLNEACDRVLLQRVGGGYVFIHRALLEHFAQIRLTSIKS